MENVKPKLKNKKYLNKIQNDSSTDYNNNYFSWFNDSLKIKNKYNNINTLYNLKAPKLFSNILKHPPFLQQRTVPRKNSRYSIYTENNKSYDILHNLRNTIQMTERIKNKILNKNKSFNYRKLIPKNNK